MLRFDEECACEDGRRSPVREREREKEERRGEGEIRWRTAGRLTPY